ncbi:MAG: hypothetical protein R3C02_05480, partial [Planctomycetaceae bacterium]
TLQLAEVQTISGVTIETSRPDVKQRQVIEQAWTELSPSPEENRETPTPQQPMMRTTLAKCPSIAAPPTHPW